MNCQERQTGCPLILPELFSSNTRSFEVNALYKSVLSNQIIFCVRKIPQLNQRNIFIGSLMTSSYE
jgi:hypothetical protein